MWANQFEISPEPGTLRLRSLATKPVYDLCVETRVAGGGAERGAGPAYLAPNATWTAPHSAPADTPLTLAIDFRDESGIPGVVFATLGHNQRPPLALAPDTRLLDLAPLIGPDWTARHLLWRDVRDLDLAAPLADCAHLPPLRQVAVPADDPTRALLDARPLSGVIQMLGQDANGQAVSQVLTLADQDLAQSLPLWVRQPGLWSLLALLLSLGAVATGILARDRATDAAAR